MKTTEKELRERLRIIHAIASGQVPYASDFGRVLSITRLSDLRRPIEDVPTAPRVVGAFVNHHGKRRVTITRLP